ncbi:MAG: hypothetical protein A3B74_05130 [Candidatus Kerfeldbacteria bacterium RIFCSPHIGHO2_02_FULL_42_14]|uniref:Rieske domain-containing protein n=1 Tax=Candidatus Kerfeldbacteria bacterium RIFCSPHIGHO2_02_FULL_42_14 TaxID=1798540 RepID=A0A1G2AVI3_9BACT|nr:MAG: hypothetical protein A3B74_05130 [Candidatus Kerfeldbacteria bacterium RIFCSPHIGHO2_02_FULL_42_14]OGY81621.1 MAG: hypothetical protein A3E60_02125 [Candidatus Kerfeldbacteria bacterium RIFCSPHIGHO2_12_FULL_42_13]OGY83223.1 MAG: hypothetical protein A3I91_03530 [Candidatus Kerfeldbacteria bacterium RIFCSPLOWO2_02_FULL_42_19]OGY85528.1 MAG: hypothetical protein A3G01_01520 [Candidatus Kerfeldbacteria bacterium RIFCSPLOWO2_12_FULL_43_9]
MQKILIGTTREFAKYPTKRYSVKGHDILVSHVGDKFFATDALCTHEEVSLSEGTLEGPIITCAAHGAQFDVRTGEAQRFPAVEGLRTYPLVVEGEHIYILFEAAEK